MAFPNSDIELQTITLRDAKGFTSTFRYFWSGAAGGTFDESVAATGDIRNAFAALSNAAVQSALGWSGQTGVVQYGAQAQYLPVTIKARLTFQDAQGVLHHYHVPSPKAAIFLADLTTVNPSNGLVSTFLTKFLTVTAGGQFASSKGGVQIINFFGGMLYQAKPRRKYGVLQLTPALTPEEPGE